MPATNQSVSDARTRPQVIVVMGVSGAGKTTVGRALTAHLHYEFYEGDDYHPQENREKMHAGVALTDADRLPWLQAIRALIVTTLARGASAVVSCSALKADYRDFLRRDGVCFVYLRVSREVVRERLAQRAGHFFDPRLLDSQFAALEEPRTGLIVDAEQPPEQIAREIARRLAEC